MPFYRSNDEIRIGGIAIGIDGFYPSLLIHKNKAKENNSIHQHQPPWLWF